MLDNPQELRRINLTEVFPFTQLFRSFKLAIHHHKLLLALIAVILTYALGRVMDTIWPDTVTMPPTPLQTVLPTATNASTGTEVQAFLSEYGDVDFCVWCDTAREMTDEHRAALLTQLDPNMKLEDARKWAADGRAEDEIHEAVGDARRDAETVLHGKNGIGEKLDDLREEEAGPLWKAYETVSVAALIGPAGNGGPEAAITALDVLARDKDKDKKNDLCTPKEKKAVIKAIMLGPIAERAGALGGRGIFDTLLKHEIATFRGAIRSMLALDIGISSDPAGGLKASFIAAIGGICWFFGAHWFYAVVFTLFSLLIWSLFGGAICRIAALHAARDEKISLSQSLKFSGRKMFSFFSAPLIPIALIVAVGAVLTVGGIISAIPYFGEIFAGIFWPLALVGGFVMALVLIGTVSGSILMFPTIAVEGSDSFDALSRSFSYVYSKPWRTGFYVLVSGIYGAICYLFVRLFAHVLLNLVHMWAGLGMNVDGSSYLPETVGKLDAMWTRAPVLESGQFFGSFGQYPLNGTESFGSFIITVWTFIVVGLVVSFAVSFFFSASTMIYYLLRREVDATDIEDVYLEEFEEDIAQAITPAPATQPETPADDAGDEPQEGGCQCGPNETCGQDGDATEQPADAGDDNADNAGDDNAGDDAGDDNAGKED